MLWPSWAGLASPAASLPPQFSSSPREHRKETLLGARGAEGSQISSSYGWIPRGGGDRKSSGGFSRQTADVQLDPGAQGSSLSQRTLGCLSKDRSERFWNHCLRLLTSRLRPFPVNYKGNGEHFQLPSCCRVLALYSPLGKHEKGSAAVVSGTVRAEQ